MKQFWVMAGLILVGVVGCASMPGAPGTPIADTAVIAGKWAGTVTPGDEPST